jgi:hypothetical protein
MESFDHQKHTNLEGGKTHNILLCMHVLTSALNVGQDVHSSSSKANLVNGVATAVIRSIG